MERFPRIPEKKLAPEAAKLDARKALMLAIAAFNTAAAEPARARTAHGAEIGLAWKTEVKASPAWFERALAHVDRKDMPRMEAMVLKDAVPLTLQLRYLRAAFGETGVYLREFYGAETPDARLSTIIALVSRVSARLDSAYARSRHGASPEIFAHVRTARDAARTLDVSFERRSVKDGKEVTQVFVHNCNAFLYRDPFGDVREDTAAHCFQGADPAKMGFTRSDDADAATRMLSREEMAQKRIRPETLPVLMPGLRSGDVFGQAIVSESFDPKDHLREKTYFSIAMPLSPRVQDFLGWSAHGQYRTDLFFFVNPPSESHVIAHDGDEVTVGASGSSGSLVAMAHGKETLVVGAMVEESVVEDACTSLCYSFGIGNMPRVHESLAVARRNGPLIDEWAGDIEAAIEALESAPHEKRKP